MFCFFISVQHESCPNCPNKVDALNTKFTETYKKQKFKPYSVDGQVAGQYKNAGSFSYLRVYGAGHEVPAYKVCIEFFFYIVQRPDDIQTKYGDLDYGQAAAQFFTQIMRNESLYST